MHLQQTSLHPSDINATSYRRSLECNIHLNDRLYRENQSPSRSTGVNRSPRHFRDSFNQ